ncbi:TnsA-like heteromeric transposase endonuclease subunit [Mycobacterium hodleri]|uniref:TnsA-like heteromeric transposase endonuclease subunit n=1 Tax=Mycolicibacterium hodleri TaxID=49897 RepID=A0A544VWI4_9MYCO|nr:TnsA-like heteromeric transposase endonuclease subunit [Mycolicibacterium hodleri]TQR84344.1 TnsA-like heteromeric transposase endonuclease subunit [Mycolicibacterium hodleri]
MPSPGSAVAADALSVSDPQLTWSFRLNGATMDDWSWRQRGAPPLHQLQPVRVPRSSEFQRHIPVSAYSMTNGDIVSLESGLEHDLLRRVDRDPRVTRIVAQPLRVSWAAPTRGSHVPDLLTVHDDGTATVWDVRALDRHDEDFTTKSAITRDACLAIGWRYAVFTGLASIERLNHLWLHGFRRRPAWAGRVEEQVRRAASRPGATLGSVIASDDGTGELTSVLWHLLWHDDVTIDMAAQWELNTPVTVRRDDR